MAERGNDSVIRSTISVNRGSQNLNSFLISSRDGREGGENGGLKPFFLKDKMNEVEKKWDRNKRKMAFKSIEVEVNK